MAKAGYTIVTGGAVALSAATARSVLGAKAHANFGLDLQNIRYGFDATSGTPVLIELCQATFATNSPGTNSTSVTPVQVYGRAITVGFTAGKSWTAGNEPTVLTVIEEHLVTPTGAAMVDLPLGRTYDCDVSTGFILRFTAPGTPNVRATMLLERT